MGQFIAAGVLVDVQQRDDKWVYKASVTRLMMSQLKVIQIHFAIQWIWPVPLFILAALAPGQLIASDTIAPLKILSQFAESPWWLVRAGKIDKAQKSIERLGRKSLAVDPLKTVAMMVNCSPETLLIEDRR